MGKINILDSSIYNRIAAGEVVERPASVVKEFVENALDARAENIAISIERGGKDMILVTDDGSGIGREDLRAAFLPHATSKIARAEDLDVIRTLGFRGEALASIASVANVRIRSRAAGAAEAFELSCSGGKMGEIVPCALGGGTEIAAENLFFNTPVRAKFMKSDKGEEGEISNIVARFVLGNPRVAFRYHIDGKLALQSFGGGEDEALAAVYGGNTLSQCYKIDAQKHGVCIRGYLGNPAFTKANRTYQSTFVNGRYVINNTLGSAVANAYASYLMKRQYPLYVLYIDIPPEIVDVNVHPNKSDVRFENNQVIYGCIYSVISAVLDGNASALEYVVGAKKEDSAAPSESYTKAREESGSVSFPKGEPGDDNASDRKADVCAAEGAERPRGVSVGGARTESSAGLFDFAKPSQMKGGALLEFRDSAAREREARDAQGDAVFLENKRYLEALEQKAKQQKLLLERAEYRGCLFNTYLIYEEGEDAYLIDQHAAHERLIFDRLREEMEARKVVRQPLLVPYVLSVNREEFSFLYENAEKIREIGFEFEEFGENSFKVSAVPLDLQDIDLRSFFDELLREVGSLRGIRLSEVLRDKIAMSACKHAVKGGMILTEAEKEKLFEMLRGDMGLKCPHGRPVAVKLSKHEIEKMFKRIV